MPGNNKLYNIFFAGVLIILALPLVSIPPFFSPPDWGKTLLFRLALSLELFIFAFFLLFRPGSLRQINWKRKEGVGFLLLLGILGTFLLATVFSLDRNFSMWGSPMRSGGFINFASYIIFAVLAFLVLRHQDWKKAWNFAIIVGIAASAIALIQWQGLFSHIFVATEQRPISTFGNPILLAIYLLFLCFMSFSYGLKETAAWKKSFYFISALLFLFVIFITESRAAYLGLVLGFSYFILFYPFKSLFRSLISKGLFLLAAVIAIGFIYFVNTNQGPGLPKFILENRVLYAISQRLLLATLTDEPRFSAWQVGWKALKERPFLGYGPENFAIAFDKKYDPLLPGIQYIPGTSNNWWDRAHNSFLDIAAQAGFPAAFLYFSLFGVLLWQLQGIKKKNPEKALLAHGIQTAFIGYLAADLFAFDTFSTFLLFFFLVALSFHLIYTPLIYADKKLIHTDTKPMHANPHKLAVSVLICVLVIILIWFNWQTTLKPLIANAEINRANSLSEQGRCQESLQLMDQTIQKDQGFLNAFFGFTYADLALRCNNQLPLDSRVILMQKGKEALTRALKLQPLYTRGWIAMGGMTNIILENEVSSDGDKKQIQKLAQEATDAFQRALALSPKHQETYIEWAKTSLIMRDFQGAKEKANACLALYSETGACWWLLARAEIAGGNDTKGEKAMQQATLRRYDIHSEQSLLQLANAYAEVSSFEKLATIYEELVQMKPSNPQYRASLATAYKFLGRKAEAREQALKVLELQPQMKKDVDQFLQNL